MRIFSFFTTYYQIMRAARRTLAAHARAMSAAAAPPAASPKLWGGRFTGATDPAMEAFNNSIGFDKRMWKADLDGSAAYANALAKAGLLQPQEAAELVRGLRLVGAEWEKGQFRIAPGDEDIHTANERRLGEHIGALAGKLHTGRSRNDQVATDVRLWLKVELRGLRAHLLRLTGVAAARAAAEVEHLMPGYTHLQPAQPVRWGHWLLSHAWAWQRDVGRLDDALARMDAMPLGSGALAGHAFGLDRAALAAELGFAGGPTPNSMDAVSDRDFALETLAWASITSVHLSRWAEDLIIYSSAEFGFVGLSDAYSTGSSLMPQKKNPGACVCMCGGGGGLRRGGGRGAWAFLVLLTHCRSPFFLTPPADALELLRGKTGRVVGALTSLLVTVKGLPSTYNKDLQEDKEPLFDAIDTLKGTLPIAVGVLSTLTPRPERMAARLAPEMLATDLADYLVRKGVPFRETHHVAGAAVRLAESTGVPLSSLTPAQLRTLHAKFEDDVAKVWSFQASVEARDAAGGTSKRSVLEQAAKLSAWVAEMEKR